MTCSSVIAALQAESAETETEAEFVRLSYLPGVKFEKSAQPVSELEVAEGEELHPASGRTSVEEEEEEEDKGEEAAGLFGLGAGTVDVPVSMGISSKLAVHTGPKSNTKLVCKSKVKNKETLKHLKCCPSIRLIYVDTFNTRPYV